jgi:hypothetical protein
MPGLYGLYAPGTTPMGMPFPQAPQMASSDRDALIRTIAGEAGNQGPTGQAALAHVVMSRLAAGGYGDTVKDIVQAPAAGVNPARGYHEFSTWNAPARGGNSIPQNMSSSDPAYTSIGDIVECAIVGSIVRLPPPRPRRLASLIRASLAGVLRRGLDRGMMEAFPSSVRTTIPRPGAQSPGCVFSSTRAS